MNTQRAIVVVVEFRIGGVKMENHNSNFPPHSAFPTSHSLMSPSEPNVITSLTDAQDLYHAMSIEVVRVYTSTKYGVGGNRTLLSTTCKAYDASYETLKQCCVRALGAHADPTTVTEMGYLLAGLSRADIDDHHEIFAEMIALIEERTTITASSS